MMKTRTVLTISLLLLGCSSGESDSQDKPEPRNETVGTEIARDYNRAMDKAKNVEDQVMEQKQKMDEALRDAE